MEKIIITEHISREKEIEVELPYFYQHDLSGDYDDTVIFGMIEHERHISIKRKFNDHSIGGEKSFEIEIENHVSIKSTGLACYFNPKHKSTKSAFLKAKAQLEKFLNF